MIVSDWQKYYPYFMEKEFKCKCKCGQCEMQDDFMDMLLKARIKADILFIINSGFRCSEHNKNEGGKDRSDHLTGNGSDIAIHSGRERWIIEEALLDVGFLRIGHGKNFIHVGNRPGNPIKVKWTY